MTLVHRIALVSVSLFALSSSSAGWARTSASRTAGATPTRGARPGPPKVAQLASPASPSAETSVAPDAAPAPACSKPCSYETDQAVRGYVDGLIGSQQYDKAVDYLLHCQETCPHTACQLTLLYESPISFFQNKNKYSNRTIRLAAKECRSSFVQLAEVESKDTNLSHQRETKEFDQVAVIYRKRSQPVWAGYGLIAAGAALVFTSTVLIGVAASDLLPTPGSCGKYTGVYNDPCILDFSNPGAQAALTIPLVIGVGSLATGLALALKF